MNSVMRAVVLPPSDAALSARLGVNDAASPSPSSPPEPTLCSVNMRGASAKSASSSSDGYMPPGPPGAGLPAGGGSCGSCGSAGSTAAFPGSLPGALSGSDTWSHSETEARQTTRFVLFDFTVVSGLDATAARSCFLNLTRTLTPLGITIVFGGVKKGEWDAARMCLPLLVSSLLLLLRQLSLIRPLLLLLASCVPAASHRDASHPSTRLAHRAAANRSRDSRCQAPQCRGATL